MVAVEFNKWCKCTNQFSKAMAETVLFINLKHLLITCSKRKAYLNNRYVSLFSFSVTPSFLTFFVDIVSLLHRGTASHCVLVVVVVRAAAVVIVGVVVWSALTDFPKKGKGGG